jgi:hypothetical protein
MSEKPLAPQLAGYIEELRAVRADAEDLLAGLSDRQCNWRPPGEGWSIAQCLEHLNLLGYRVLLGIDAGLSKARERRWLRDGPFEYGFVGTRFIRWMEPSSGMKLRAPAIYRPPEGHSAADAGARFLALQDELSRRVRESDGIDLGRIKIASPITRLVRFNLATWFAALAAHERRHLRQAWRTKRTPGFPPS